MAIPRVIHQTHTSEDYSGEIRRNVEYLKEINPGWDYRFYDDAAILRFIEREFPRAVRDAYLRINPRYGAARADLFRYLLMYRIGGVYLDIKSSVTKPLDEILRPDDEYVLSHWPNAVGQTFEGWGMHGTPKNFPEQGEFQNWHVMCRPQHPFLHHVIGLVLKLIENYTEKVLGVGRTGVLTTTGPIPYTVAIHGIRTRHIHRLAHSHVELGLLYSIFESSGLDAHKGVFKTHYSSLREPVVLPPVASG